MLLVVILFRKFKALELILGLYFLKILAGRVLVDILLLLAH